jgi:hypothetical protein
MDIACEVEIEILHGHDLRITAAGCAALDAEGRALRRLADGRHHRFPEVRAQSLRKSDGCRRFALAEWGRGDGSHIDVLAIWPLGQSR